MEENLQELINDGFEKLYPKETPYIRNVLKLFAEDKTLKIYEVKKILKLSSELIDEITLFS